MPTGYHQPPAGWTDRTPYHPPVSSTPNSHADARTDGVLPRNDPIRKAQDRFIESWGRMGSSWGISRTMAEVHALLFITGEPLCTDDVMERLNVSRGNASMTLRALTDWGIVRRSHKRGDRKEYFQAEQDIWVMFRTIVRERKKRELDPIVTSLFDIRDQTAGDVGVSTAGTERAELHNQRLDDMLGFFQKLDALAETLLGAEGDELRDTLTLLAGENE